MPNMTLTTIPIPKATGWDEADLLRAAAVIADELGDRQPHPWSDVIEAVREVTEDGSRFQATKLAYEALTSYLEAVPMVWTGDPGQRVVALSPTPKAAQGVHCPTCGVLPGQSCVRMRTKGKRPTRVAKKWPHDERLAAAVAPPA